MDIDETMVLSPRMDVLSRSGGQHPLQAICVAVIDPSYRLRECIASRISEGQRFRVEGFESVDDFSRRGRSSSSAIVMLYVKADMQNAAKRDVSRLQYDNSACPVVVLTDTQDVTLLTSFLQLGARGVVPLTFPASVVLEVLETVLAGGTFAPFKVNAPTVQNKIQRLLPRSCGLTNREEQVVSLLRSGKPNKQIAYELDLSIGTVKVHLHNIMLKLGARNRIQVLALQGLIAATNHAAFSAATCTDSIADLIHDVTAGAKRPA